MKTDTTCFNPLECSSVVVESIAYSRNIDDDLLKKWNHMWASDSKGTVLHRCRNLQGKPRDHIYRAHDPRNSGSLTHNNRAVPKRLSSRGHFRDFPPAEDRDLSAICDELMNSSLMLDPEIVSQMILALGGTHNFDKVSEILRQVELRDPELLPDVYTSAITAFGKRGHLEPMEKMVKEMVSKGYPVNSTVGNAYVIYYGKFGSLAASEAAYNRLKRSRVLIEEEAIRALASLYIKENKFFGLGSFVRDVGLGRKNAGNILWNLLLLSYAARFKMKTLQREFVNMVESGFGPDLSTFNIRSLAFSGMSLMWDLHLSLEHMSHEGVGPDLVTYGCVVDAYVERKLGKNLMFALGTFDLDECASVSTDQIVFEAMGKGDFHSSSEVAMEYAEGRRIFTYKDLISRYLKREFGRNLIFWNR